MAAHTSTRAHLFNSVPNGHCAPCYTACRTARGRSVQWLHRPTGWRPHPWPLAHPNSWPACC
eukprot:344913-Pelagomonas_calceolata.AAC.6